MNLRSLRDIFRYPSAVAGILVILALVAVSIYAVFAIPYDKAVRLWRGGEADWYRYPKNAAPVWFNWFRTEKLPETIVLDRESPAVEVSIEESSPGKTITYTFPFDYQADGFPDDVIIFFTADYDEKAPFAGLTWTNPAGEEIILGNFAVQKKFSYRPAQDEKLKRKLSGQPANTGLFADRAVKDSSQPVKGSYQLKVECITFDATSDVNVELVVYGKLAGWAGTDHLRRDLLIALLWGTPVALSFGLLAAVGTSLTQLIFAGIGTWFGGWVDGIIQRVTEINMILPTLPILIMIGTFYSRSILIILSCVILLSIFGAGIKTYRAVLLQVKESPYIEAARSYGASSTRIIFVYMIPRLIPMLVPQFIILVPAYVFLEASLAVLGLGDPTLPTWGKIIDESRANGALFQGWYYWVLEPSLLLMVTGLAFSAVGYALDRIFNPRLRGQ